MTDRTGQTGNQFSSLLFSLDVFADYGSPLGVLRFPGPLKYVVWSLAGWKSGAVVLCEGTLCWALPIVRKAKMKFFKYRLSFPVQWQKEKSVPVSTVTQFRVLIIVKKTNVSVCILISPIHRFPVDLFSRLRSWVNFPACAFWGDGVRGTREGICSF